MPYPLTGEGFDELHDRLQKTYPWIQSKGTRHFARAFNSALESYGNEGQAFATAYAALNKAGYSKAPSDEVGALCDPVYKCVQDTYFETPYPGYYRPEGDTRTMLTRGGAWRRSEERNRGASFRPDPDPQGPETAEFIAVWNQEGPVICGEQDGAFGVTGCPPPESVMRAHPEIPWHLAEFGQWQDDPELNPAGPVPVQQCPGCVDPEQEQLERRIRNRMGIQYIAALGPHLQEYLDQLKPGGALAMANEWELSQASAAAGLSPETLATLKHLVYADGPAWWDADPQWGALESRGCMSFGATLSPGSKALTWSLVIGGIVGAVWAIRRL